MNYESIFEISLKTKIYEFNELSKSYTNVEVNNPMSLINTKRKKVFILIVDDEFIIRNAMKRLITTELKKDIEIIFVEANDGVEFILAVYLANLNQIKFNFIISDENMSYINGSHAIEIIKLVVKSGKFQDVPIFMSTANSTIEANYANSDKVRKVFSKPMDRNSIRDLLMICDIL